ncbi:MAG: ABC transporter substrate-binding protein [Bacteroidetes bacterium]|nr:ABC transporter substrate-binding protein [Bacteroidota bacterium]
MAGNKKLSTIAVLVLLNTSLFYCSCGNRNENSGKKVFHINYSSGTLESADPAFAKNLYAMWTDHMLYNTLFETDGNLNLAPSLATGYEVSEDGLSYILHLRTDVFFHDAPEFVNGIGRKMTAADVVYSFNRIINPSVASPGAWIFNGRVDSLHPFTAINDSTLVIKLVAPFRPLLKILSMPYCSVVPHEVVEKWGKDFRAHPCGTGPFMFTYWDEGNTFVAHKNPKYWEKDADGNSLPYLDAVQITFNESKATEFMLFMQKKLDFMNGLDGSFKDVVLSKNGRLKTEYAAKFNLNKQTYLNTEYIGILIDSANPLVKNSPVISPLIRQAINYAIDRQKIVTYFKNGVTEPATSGFIPMGIPGFDSSGRYGYHYDPAKATALLAKAGFPNGKGLPEITITTIDNWADIVNFIATELQEIGIHTKVEIVQRNIELQMMSRSQLAMFRSQWIADYPDAETFLVFFNGKFPAPPNYTRFNDATFNKWYDESMNLPDSIRWKTYQAMDSLMISYAPIIPLYYDKLLHFTQKNISGFLSTPMNLIDLKKVKKD